MIDYQNLFRSVPASFLILLPDRPKFTIVEVSEKYLQDTMTKREDLMGFGIFEAFPDNPNDPEATGEANLMRSLRNVVDLGIPDAMAIQKYDIPKTRPMGEFEVRYWSPLNSPVFDDNENLVLIVHRVEDVTELMNLREQGEEQIKLTQALDKLKISESRLKQAIDNRNEALKFMEAIYQSILSHLNTYDLIKFHMFNNDDGIKSITKTTKEE